MSAAEIIELIKKLPPEEQAEVREYVAHQTASGGGASGAPEQGIDTDRALRIGRGYIERHPELFRRLAQ